MTNKRRMALLAQAFLWTGSQIPVSSLSLEFHIRVVVLANRFDISRFIYSAVYVTRFLSTHRTLLTKRRSHHISIVIWVA